MLLTLICRKLHSAWYNGVEDFICQLSLFHQQVLLFLWEMQQRFKGEKNQVIIRQSFWLVLSIIHQTRKPHYYQPHGTKS